MKPSYNPTIARRWLLACIILGALMCLVTVLVAAAVVTQWLLLPAFVWFASAVLGALLYGLGALLGLLAPTESAEQGGDRQYGVQRFHEGQLVSRFDCKSHEQTCQMVLATWGTLPEDLVEGGAVGKEWKFSLGEGHWMIVKRQK